jgi:hypothetical protein
MREIMNDHFGPLDRDSHGNLLCDRCGKPTRGWTMSYFNTESICMPCANAERERPDFVAAVRADHTAVRRGDYNFPGIGLRR